MVTVNDIHIEYNFSWEKGQAIFKLNLDAQTLALKINPLFGLPSWTKLDYHQCPNCPLTVEQAPHCPAAIGLLPVINNFSDVDSEDEMELEVTLSERRIIQKAPAQRAIRSIMGVLFATSGCPHAKFFRPMICYHLPLSDDNETIMRASSMYMLAQHFKYKNGGEPDMQLDGLKDIYEKIQIVNVSMTERLQSVDASDSSINAMILLDMFTEVIPSAIQSSLEELRYLFDPHGTSL